MYSPYFIAAIFGAQLPKCCNQSELLFYSAAESMPTRSVNDGREGKPAHAMDYVPLRQQQLVMQEKMASLDQLAAGSAWNYHYIDPHVLWRRHLQQCRLKLG